MENKKNRYNIKVCRIDYFYRGNETPMNEKWHCVDVATDKEAINFYDIFVKNESKWRVSFNVVIISLIKNGKSIIKSSLINGMMPVEVIL